MKIFEITLREDSVMKLSQITPGVTATVDNGDGTKTEIDLRKNPTALVKSPDGKIMMNKSGITSGGTQTATPDPASMMKPGEPVFSTEPTTETADRPKVRTIAGPHGRLTVDQNRKGVTKVSRRGFRTDEPDREKQVGRGRPVGSSGFTPGVGVPQRNSFSDVHTDWASGRRRPRFDPDFDDDQY